MFHEALHSLELLEVIGSGFGRAPAENLGYHSEHNKKLLQSDTSTVNGTSMLFYLINRTSCNVFIAEKLRPGSKRPANPCQNR